MPSARAVLLLSILGLVESNLLRAKGPPAAESIDDQIEKLKSEIAAKEDEVADVKNATGLQGIGVENDFQHHCSKDVKLALDSPEVKGKEVKKQPLQEATGFAAAVQAAEQKTLVNNEEFLLGLLIMHETRKNWSLEQKLDALCEFAHDSPIIEQLYRHHDKSKPFAAQLAALMDKERKTMAPTKAPPIDLDGKSTAQIIATVMR